MKRFLSIATLTVFLTLSALQFSSAQCAMCAQNAENSLKDGNNDAKGLNFGIMYLLIAPYALVGGLGYWWYIKNKKSGAASGENSIG